MRRLAISTDKQPPWFFQYICRPSAMTSARKMLLQLSQYPSLSTVSSLGCTLKLLESNAPHAWMSPSSTKEPLLNQFTFALELDTAVWKFIYNNSSGLLIINSTNLLIICWTSLFIIDSRVVNWVKNCCWIELNCSSVVIWSFSNLESSISPKASTLLIAIPNYQMLWYHFDRTI